MADPSRLDELQRRYAENPRRYFAPLANEFRKAGELQTAIDICREQLARYPGHMSGHVVLGQALYEARDARDAQSAFERALQLDPENLIALRHLGDIARDRGDGHAARGWYQRVLEADPRNDDIAAQLAQLSPPTGRRTPAASAAIAAPPMAPIGASSPAPISVAAMEPLEWSALDLELPGHERPLAEANVERTAEHEAVTAAMPDDPVARAVAAPAAGSAPTDVVTDDRSALDPDPEGASAGTSVAAGSTDIVDVEGFPPTSELSAIPSTDEQAGGAEGAPSVPAALDWVDLLPTLDDVTDDTQEFVAERAVEHEVGALAPTTLSADSSVERTEAPVAGSDPTVGLMAEPAEPQVRALEDPQDVVREEVRTDVAAVPTAGPTLEEDHEVGAAPTPPWGVQLTEDRVGVTEGESLDSSPLAAGADADLVSQPVTDLVADVPYDPVVGLDLPPVATPPELVGEEDRAPAPAGAFVTETMAGLLLRQGHVEQALDVYAQLLSQRPDDESLAGRVAELRARHGDSADAMPASPDAADEPPHAEDATIAPSAGAFFAALAAAPTLPSDSRPMEADVPVAVDAEAPAPERSLLDGTDVSAADDEAARRLAGAFGGAPPDGPTLLELLAARGEAATRAPAPGPVLAATPMPDPLPTELPSSAPAAPFSFDRFFEGLEEEGAPVPDDATPASPTAGAWNVAAPSDARPVAEAADAAPRDPWDTFGTDIARRTPNASAASIAPSADAPSTAASTPTAESTPTAAEQEEDLAQFHAWLKGLLEP